MSRQPKPNEIERRHNGIAKRAGAFLDQAFAGPHKDKRIAQHLGISPNMASLLRRGQSWTVERLDQVRNVYGADFAASILGALDFDFAGLRSSLQQVLERLPPHAPSVGAQFWFDDAGHCIEAPAGLAELIRRRTGLSIHVRGDLVASTCRNRGWLALERDSAGRVAIHHHATAVDRNAARACRAWLIGQAAALTRVRRLVEIDGTVAEVDHDDALAAAAALERLTQSRTHAYAPFSAERKPLDEAPDDMGEILRVYHEAPDHVIAAAIDAGLMPISSILTARGSSITNDFMGSAIGLDRADIIGKNVLDRRDAAYGAFVHSQITAALKEPTLSEVKGTAYGQPLHYQRVAIPAGNSQVLSIARPFRRTS